MPISISLQNPQLISISKRLEKNSAGLPVKFITEYTVKGKILANGINGGLTLPTIQANLSSILPSISVTGAPVGRATKLVSFSLDKSDSQDTIEKDYILILENHAALPSSAYGDLNLTPKDLLDVSDLKVEESEENTVTTITKTLSISITYTDVSYSSSYGSARSLAEKINSNVNSNSQGRVTLSAISDENSRTYSFVFNFIKFAAGGKELNQSVTRNISIGSNGAIIGTETLKQYAGSDSPNPDFSNLEYAPEPSESQLKNFIQEYIRKGGGSSSFRDTFFKTNYRKSIDYIIGLKTTTITITNSPEYVANEGIINLVEVKTRTEYPTGAEKRVVRGSIVGFGRKATTPKNNPKFQSAKSQFSRLIGEDFTKAIRKEKIDTNTYLTNASINGDITEGSINFDITYEKRPEFGVKDSNILYGSAGIYANSEMHLGNIFLVVGSKDTQGKEIIQESNQSKPAEFTLKLEAISKSINFKPCVDLFKNLIEQNVNGVIKSVNITTSTRSKSFQGAASWKQYGRYRAKNDLSQKSKVIEVSI